MQVINSLDKENISWDSCVLTLGDFDGLHKGHIKLITKTLNIAKKKKLPVVLVTYEPSPKKILGKLANHSDIYTKEEKISILQQYAFDAIIFIPFTPKMLQIKASLFLKNILLKYLQAKHIVIGHDHCFGKNRHGNYRYLKLAEQRYNFNVYKIKAVTFSKRVISSSSIRAFIEQGEISKANKALGRPFHIEGKIIHGKQRGKNLLNIPTANISIHNNKVRPSPGVYAGLVQISSEWYKAAINIGYNPTFKNPSLSIEAHILDMNKQIYGLKMTLFLFYYIRKEKKFSSVALLSKQIQQDIKRTRKLMHNKHLNYKSP